jgi:hypothetical protein
LNSENQPSFIHSLTHPFICSLVHSFILHSSIHSLTHSSIHLLIHSLDHYLFTDSFILHSFIHSLSGTFEGLLCPRPWAIPRLNRHRHGLHLHTPADYPEKKVANRHHAKRQSVSGKKETRGTDTDLSAYCTSSQHRQQMLVLWGVRKHMAPSWSSPMPGQQRCGTARRKPRREGQAPRAVTRLKQDWRDGFQN